MGAAVAKREIFIEVYNGNTFVTERGVYIKRRDKIRNILERCEFMNIEETGQSLDSSVPSYRCKYRMYNYFFDIYPSRVDRSRKISLTSSASSHKGKKLAVVLNHI